LHHYPEDEAYIQELYKTLNYSNEQFDKHVLFIASGALGISFAFIEKIVNLKEAASKDLLIEAWRYFAAVIFVSLISHFVSSLSIRWSISHYGEESWDKKSKQWNYIIRGLNILMISGLLYATLSLINFINQNI
jgi:hypothetical protein